MMMEATSLQRFVTAQETTYNRAFAEITQGRKESHWMWYIFPQIQGLGTSNTAKFYAIKDLKEAEAFLNHPVLGERLVRICEQLLKSTGNDAFSIFGSPDNMKLKSSMTLFAALNTNPVFDAVLDKFFHGKKDDWTLTILGK